MMLRRIDLRWTYMGRRYYQPGYLGDQAVFYPWQPSALDEIQQPTPLASIATFEAATDARVVVLNDYDVLDVARTCHEHDVFCPVERGYRHAH